MLYVVGSPRTGGTASSSSVLGARLPHELTAVDRSRRRMPSRDSCRGERVRGAWCPVAMIRVQSATVTVAPASRAGRLAKRGERLPLSSCMARATSPTPNAISWSRSSVSGAYQRSVVHRRPTVMLTHR
jgi:hypothetical protein